MQRLAKRPTFSKWSRRGAEPQGLPEWAARRRRKIGCGIYIRAGRDGKQTVTPLP
jgi:hypothetical protein